VYVGSIKAAGTLSILRERGITKVVNCQSVTSRNVFEGKESAGITYFRFPVADHSYNLIAATKSSSRLGESHAESHAEPSRMVLEYLAPLFAFVDTAVAEGDSVLIHCLAGAHRAGTTGVVYIMHKADVGMVPALALAQRCRKVINPFGALVNFIVAYDAARALS
jgi:protein-tyrosine phosphatase